MIIDLKQYNIVPILTLHWQFLSCLHNIKNLTINGSGSTFVLNGQMTNIAIYGCENIIIKNNYKKQWLRRFLS